MTTVQIIFAAAAGFLLGQSVLYGARQLYAAVRTPRVRAHPAPRRGSLVSGFIRYAAPLGAGAALLTLGAWALSDYLAAARANHAVASAAAVEPQSPASASSRQGAPIEEVAVAPEPDRDVADAAPGQPQAQNAATDPFADPEFKVHRAVHHGPATLKETLLQKSEAKARAELVAQMEQHRARSQYDCEAAVRVNLYLKAGLDVWGFAAWQRKYFPTEGYHGATLPECRELDNVLDPHGVDLHAAIAQHH